MPLERLRAKRRPIYEPAKYHVNVFLGNVASVLISYPESSIENILLSWSGYLNRTYVPSRSSPLAAAVAAMEEAASAWPLSMFERLPSPDATGMRIFFLGYSPSKFL